MRFNTTNQREVAHADRLFDAERRFMEIIWETEPVNSTELCRLTLSALGWKKSTTYNMLRRLWSAVSRKTRRLP